MLLLCLASLLPMLTLLGTAGFFPGARNPGGRPPSNSSSSLPTGAGHSGPRGALARAEHLKAPPADAPNVGGAPQKAGQENLGVAGAQSGLHGVWTKFSHGNPEAFCKKKEGGDLGLAAVVAHNDATRRSVTTWIEVDDWKKGLYKFGLTKKHKVDRLTNHSEVGVVTVHDIVSLFAAHMQQTQPIAYLEIGVSVCKCLFTQLNFLCHPSSRIYALDVENINPTMERMLGKAEVISTWTSETLEMKYVPTKKSTRRSPEAIKVRYSLFAWVE